MMEGEDRQQEGQQQCPRCLSIETKFGYFNNNKKSQPRYFCKACRRYWTQGGKLRNIPVGGGVKKRRRSRAPSSSTSSGGGAEIWRAALSSPPPDPALVVGSGAGVNNLYFSSSGFRLATQIHSCPQPPPPQLTITRGYQTSLLRGSNIGLNPFVINPVGTGQDQGQTVGQLYQLPHPVQAPPQTVGHIHPNMDTGFWTSPLISTTPAFPNPTISYTPFASNAAMYWDNTGGAITGTPYSSSIHQSGHLPGFGPFD